MLINNFCNQSNSAASLRNPCDLERNDPKSSRSGAPRTITFLLVFKAKSKLGIPVRKVHELQWFWSYFLGFSRNSTQFHMCFIRVFDIGSHFRKSAYISTVCTPGPGSHVFESRLAENRFRPGACGSKIVSRIVLIETIIR